MSVFTRTLIAASLLLSLTACTTTNQPTISAPSPAFGDAVRANIEAQFVPPTAKQKADTFIPADIDRRELALERYRTDEVKDPVPYETTDSGE